MCAKKVFIILLIPTLVEMAFSCECSDAPTGKYEIKSLAVYNLDNSGAQPEIAPSAQIPREAYGIRFRISCDRVAFERIKGPGFFQPAYAYYCGDPEMLPVDRIVSVKIFTLNDFDENHLSDEDVSDYFSIYRSNEFGPISSFFSRESAFWVNTSRPEPDDTVRDIEFDLLLMMPPLAETTHRFRLEITLLSGTVLEQTTDEVILR